jgi:hypothetical protein
LNVWISVLTCVTRGHYLRRTLESLQRGGAGVEARRVLHVDGPAYELGEWRGWEVESVSPAVGGGARLAMLEIMRRALEAGVELLLYFEDDVIVCKNATRAMIEIGVPEPLGLVSYCDLYWHETPPLTLRAFPGCPRGRPVADGGFIGCQALAIPRRTIERLVTMPAPAWLDRNNCDATIGTSSAAYGILDSLANHVGAESAIMGRRYERLRVVRGWRGEDFDADTVPRAFELNAIGERCMLHAGVLHADGRPCAAQSAEHVAVMTGA